MTVIDVRNTQLRTIAEGESLSANYKSDFIDFKEMNVAFIQAIVRDAPDSYDGVFSLEVSLLCEADTFVPYPDSERILNVVCNNFGWSFGSVPYRYARVCYNSNSVTTGTFDLYARAKRT